jgi:hypothetical protein
MIGIVTGCLPQCGTWNERCGIELDALLDFLPVDSGCVFIGRCPIEYECKIGGMILGWVVKSKPNIRPSILVPCLHKVCICGLSMGVERNLFV